jgi:hypothetical protein
MERQNWNGEIETEIEQIAEIRETSGIRNRLI